MPFTDLTWIAQAQEHADCGRRKLNWATREDRLPQKQRLLSEAADDFRAAMQLCEDSARSLSRSPKGRVMGAATERAAMSQGRARGPEQSEDSASGPERDERVRPQT